MRGLFIFKSVARNMAQDAKREEKRDRFAQIMLTLAAEF
jgi:hypothetical protein